MATLILNESQCGRFSALAKKKGICHGIIIQGKGTVNNHALTLFGIRNQKQNVINILMDKAEASKILDYLVERLGLSESGHGIIYTTNVSCAVCDGSAATGRFSCGSEAEDESMYKKLTVIVNRGMADDVMDIAREYGAKGGTILHGRGTGADCDTKLFGMEIEPEKELIIILLPTAIAGSVTEALFRELHLDTPGQGILFVEPVSDVRGLVEVTGE
jgi:nitrogen regulatory protein PII